jgi:hypothetical protein
VNGGKGGKNDSHLQEQDLTDQHHGEHTDSLQDDKKIGQQQPSRPAAADEKVGGTTRTGTGARRTVCSWICQ